jgi:hypothetical protein
MNPTVVTEDLPALHQVANAASLTGQVSYLRLFRLNLACLVVGSLSSSYNSSSFLLMRWVHSCSAFLLAASFLLTIVIMYKNYERQWYGGRAVAESIKSSAWRYMMGAEPYMLSVEPRDVDSKFIATLQEILGEGDNLSISFAGTLAAAPQITEKMAAVRRLPLKERIRIYLDDRISDQRNWYGKKSEHNATQEKRLFIYVTFSQLAALIFAVVNIANPLVPINLVGVFSTLSASFLAWLQVKRHQEQSQSYAVAAHELGCIAAQAQHLTGDDDFSTFVADAETAISREHILWVARRDRVPRFTIRGVGR